MPEPFDFDYIKAVLEAPATDSWLTRTLRQCVTEIESQRATVERLEGALAQIAVGDGAQYATRIARAALSEGDEKPATPEPAKWFGQYMVGKWTEEVRHAEPCDCTEGEETAGERCMANSEWSHALLIDGGGFAPQLAYKIPPEVADLINRSASAGPPEPHACIPQCRDFGCQDPGNPDCAAESPASEGEESAS